MREAKYIPPSATRPDTQNNQNIPSKANLDNATTAQSKPKRRTKKYRAIERPDGIIVEYPRYRPAGSSQKPTIGFKQDSIPSNYNCTQHKPTKEPTPSNARHDLMGIGSSFCVVSADNIGSDVCIGPLGRGRAGYNEEATCENACIQVVADRGEQQLYHESTPMARFLLEQGPRSSFSLHKVPQEPLELYRPSASLVSKGIATGGDSAFWCL